MFEIVKNIRATVSEFQGKTRIDIRKYFEKDGNVLPKKNGINLSVEEFRAFAERWDEMVAHIEEELTNE